MEIHPDDTPHDRRVEPAPRRQPAASPHMSPEAFRADQDAVLDGEVADPFER